MDHGRIRLVRMVGGVAVVATLIYVGLVLSRDEQLTIFLVIMAVVALVGGLVMGSWWSLVAVPLTILATVQIQHLLWTKECENCRPADVNLGGQIMLIVIYMIVPPSLFAALGTWLSQQVPQIYRRFSTRARGRA